MGSFQDNLAKLEKARKSAQETFELARKSTVKTMKRAEKKIEETTTSLMQEAERTFAAPDPYGVTATEDPWNLMTTERTLEHELHREFMLEDHQLQWALDASMAEVPVPVRWQAEGASDTKSPSNAAAAAQISSKSPSHAAAGQTSAAAADLSSSKSPSNAGAADLRSSKSPSTVAAADPHELDATTPSPAEVARRLETAKERRRVLDQDLRVLAVRESAAALEISQLLQQAEDSCMIVSGLQESLNDARTELETVLSRCAALEEQLASAQKGCSHAAAEGVTEEHLLAFDNETSPPREETLKARILELEAQVHAQGMTASTAASPVGLEAEQATHPDKPLADDGQNALPESAASQQPDRGLTLET